MKRPLRKLSMLAMFLGLISLNSFGQIATPPVIDGDGSDAVWATVPAWDLLRQNLYLSDFIDGPDDFSATIKAIWDADAIYCLLEVKDDTLDTQSNQAWERDHWSIYFDMSNIKQNGALLDDKAEPMDSVQFMLEKVWSVEGDIDLQLAINKDTLKWDADFVETVDSGTSYLLELAVPFSDIGVTLEDGMTIGFDAKVGDNDGDGQLDGKLALYQSADEGWHNASYIGTAMLEADGSISRVKQAPVIDGVEDYTWYNAKKYDLTVKNLYLEDFVDDAADFSGSFKVMHDYDNIYVLLNVKDDTLDTQSNQAWERDHWSVYFDMSNLKQNGALLDDKAEPMDSVQFMLEKVWSVEGDIDLQLAINKDTLKWGVDFAEAIDSGSNYVAEIAVPFSRIGVPLTDGMVIGYDTKIGDNDGDGQLDAKLAWHQSADEGWHNAAYLGNMTLDPVFFDLGPLSKATAQIEVDGVEDGDWTHAIAMPLERQNLYLEDFVEGPADFSGVIKALWDPDNFYVLLKVQDDTLDTQSNQAWERDHWSVYFDISNIKQDGELLDDLAEPMDSVQFMLEKVWSVEGDIDLQLAINKDTLKWNEDFVEVIDSGSNYMLELVVPFSDIGVTLSEGMVIGWDAKIGDNDGDGQLDAKLAWNQLADEGWHNASYLGEVELMPNGTIFGTPVIAPEDVTFNVDMNGMIDAEVFDPAADFVDIAGSFNNWGDPVVQAADDDEDGIYTYVLADQEVGAELEYKFRVNGQWDPISEFPGGGPNRTYTVVEGENVVNVVFNDGDYSAWIEGVEQDEASHLQIYPNPARDALHIFSRSEILSVSITNLVGQSLLNIPVNRPVTSIDISTLDRGVYIVSVQFKSLDVTNSVFVKQ
jgi:hypothetical protein